MWDGIGWDRANEKRLEASATLELCWYIWPGLVEVEAVQMGADPPDCVVRLRDGVTVGGEVSRLIDREVLEVNLSPEVRTTREREMREAAETGRPADVSLAHGRRQFYRYWSRELMIDRLHRLIADKDAKSFGTVRKDGSSPPCTEAAAFSERWLLLLTNEIDLDERRVREWLSTPERVEFVARQLDRIFLMFPWGPTEVRASVPGSIREVAHPASFVGPIVELDLTDPV